MRTLFAAAAFAAGFSAFAASAAEPGPAILTAGAAKTQTVRTAGVGYTEINGVRIYEGTPRVETAEEMLLGDEPACASQEVDIVILHRPWRRLRHLRTQGFYSGVPYPSARYTQGFYSGR